MSWFSVFWSSAKVKLPGDITLAVKFEDSVKVLGVTGHESEIKMAIFLENCTPKRSALLEL